MRTNLESEDRGCSEVIENDAGKNSFGEGSLEDLWGIFGGRRLDRHQRTLVAMFLIEREGTSRQGIELGEGSREALREEFQAFVDRKAGEIRANWEPLAAGFTNSGLLLEAVLVAEQLHAELAVFERAVEELGFSVPQAP